jgi:hypothetical protein
MFPARSKILRFAKNLSPSGQRRIKQGGRSKRKKREEGTAVISKGRRLFRETIGLAVAMDEPECRASLGLSPLLSLSPRDIMDISSSRSRPKSVWGLAAASHFGSAAQREAGMDPPPGPAP